LGRFQWAASDAHLIRSNTEHPIDARTVDTEPPRDLTRTNVLFPKRLDLNGFGTRGRSGRDTSLRPRLGDPSRWRSRRRLIHYFLPGALALLRDLAVDVREITVSRSAVERRPER
jgi:hypothetical protein